MHLLRSGFLSGTLLISVALAGCNPADDKTAENPTLPAAESNAPVADVPPESAAGPTATPAALGTEQAAGPYQVTLTTRPQPPTVGSTQFTANVTQNGAAVIAANVNLQLSGPGGMKKTITLVPVEGHYGAAEVLAVHGPWTADINIKQGDNVGSAIYTFDVAEK
ncbi:MAG: FixH family protein [Armatimonadetes bacterium]|nr:FixH family protein [Armatimonadota bacterium]